MLLTRALPPGPPIEAEQAYGDLRLHERAPDGRPYVACNLVSSADGKATLHGRSGGLGGPGDRVAFHQLRAQVDAILAGTRTLRVENYGRMIADVAMQRRRVAESRHPQPLAVVITGSGNVPFDIPLFADPGSHVALYAPRGMDVPPTAAQVDRHPLEHPRQSLPEVLASLRDDHGIRSLLCEGGPTLLNSMIAAQLVDELFLTLAPALVGGGELGLTRGDPVAHVLELGLVAALELDGTLLLRYARR